jgi:predicted RNase H-like HicB family nuclease
MAAGIHRLNRRRAGAPGPIDDSIGTDANGAIAMEHVIQLHIEKLPEGVYLATSDQVQGLIAQGRTIQETLEIARDVAKKLIESQAGPNAAEELK